MQRLLLDTCVLLWLLQGSSRLNSKTLRQIEEPLNQVYVSAASAWEIAIKRALGKLDAPENLGDVIAKTKLTILPVTIAHTESVAHLPRIHGDPFDRMLVAQAQAENLTLVTSDPKIWKYDVQILRV